MYTMSRYKDNIRFHEQYGEIHNFLQAVADGGCNEHFHWGRLDWMMAHSYLDTERLTRIALFRNEKEELAGVATYDTEFQDRWYLLHAVSDEALLRQMIEYAVNSENGPVTVKANHTDTMLCGLLEREGFERRGAGSVLQMELSQALPVRLPRGFALNAPDLELNNRQWRLVIHRGFDQEGLPEEWSEAVEEAAKHLEIPAYIKVFAMKGEEYAAHCGMWYRGGETAYIEPVVTLPEHRGKGLGRAVVYEAMGRARERGAKRAIVLSDQKFYFRIGMTKSSEVITWGRDGR